MRIRFSSFLRRYCLKDFSLLFLRGNNLLSMVLVNTAGRKQMLKGDKMKNYFNLTLLFIVSTIFALPLTALSQTGVGGEGEAHDYSYTYKGKTITLVPSEELFAVEEEQGGGNLESFAVAEGFDELKDDKQPSQKFRIFRRSSQETAFSGDSNMESVLSRAPHVGQEVQPVFEQGGALLIPTDKLIVGFTNPTTLSQAKAKLEPLKESLKIKAIENHRKNSFSVTFEDASHGRVYDVTKKLSALSGVEFAEPDHVVVFLNDPSPQIPNMGQLDEQFKLNSNPPTPSPGAPQPVPIPGNSEAAAGQLAWTTLLEANFEGSNIPSGWSTTGRTNPDVTWAVTGHRAHAGTHSIHATSGGSNGVPAPGNYPGNVVSILASPLLWI